MNFVFSFPLVGQFKRKEEQWKEKLANAQENEQDVVSEFEGMFLP